MVIVVTVLALLGAVVGYLLAGSDPATVRGVVGTEKATFFADPRVREAFEKHGLRLEIEARGSREMATADALAGHDFGFPASAQAAGPVARARPASGTYEPFGSPLAVATFTSIVDLLAQEGAARRGGAGHWVLDLAAYLDLAGRDLRWDQIAGNVAYPARRDVLVTTTHPSYSGSAAGYAWLAATHLGPDGLDRVAKLFTDQGGLERSTGDPFERYLTQGLNFAPLVLAYEAQYIGAAAAGTLPDGATLMYLSPTLLSTHTVVAFTERGDEVGELLTTDPTLRSLAAEHGYRTGTAADFATVLDRLAGAGTSLPAQLPEAAPPPDPVAFEAMLTALDQRLRQ
ncbi:hypothetical protein GCM10009779_44250 [Polymorphospora rubra]|uniref:Uncharacterized protein n=2 Tax=Polymorphospora rubra TaxID=338584 RepID=A0A810N6C5_9ACTN|nr:hypothetical protein Prubr_55510 [Polymorphospora rubra]